MKPLPQLFLIAAGWVHPLNLFTLIALSILFSAQTHSEEIRVEYVDRGFTIIMPPDWQFEMHPPGFNNYGHSWEWNPTGKLPGTWLWEGWPEWDKYCKPERIPETAYSCSEIKIYVEVE